MLEEKNIINDSSIPTPEIVDLGFYYITEDGVIENTTISGDDFQDLSLSALRERFLNLDENKTALSDFINEMTFALNSLEFEFGIKSNLEDIFNKYHDKFGVLCVEWLSKLFIKNIYDQKIVLGIILLLSRLNPDDFGALGETMIFNALFVSNNVEIKEAAIRVIERWNATELINTLQNLHFEAAWLEDYKLSVIKDISE